MLNVTSIRGNNQYAAAHYFSGADDYYVKESPGEWQGIGADKLNLSGPIQHGQLARLLNGDLPNGKRIEATFDSMTKKKRMGLDLTFSAPKSVSMQALVAGDRGVLNAHDHAVRIAIEQTEQLAEARKKVQGKSTRERTGSMVIGKFRHEMSRAKDPQLHTHAVILNMTQRSDGEWRALSNEDVFKAYHSIDAIYKAELAKGLQQLGYQIRVVDAKGNFELAHISRDQIEAFSARGLVIEEALANQGKTRATATTLEKQIIALATRPRKDEKDRELVKSYWAEKSRALNIDYGLRSTLDGRSYDATTLGGTNSQRENTTSTAAQAQTLPASITPAQAVVQYAVRHLTERESVMREGLLLTAATRRAVGLANNRAIRLEIERLVKQGTLIEAAPTYRTADRSSTTELTIAGWQSHLIESKGWSNAEAAKYVRHAVKRGSLVPAEKRYATQTALKREKAILAIERDGRNAITPIIASLQLHEYLRHTPLNEGQRDAVATIVGSPNRFAGIQGDAGTGKTYTVNQAVALIKNANSILQSDSTKSGYRAVALAPYGNQVKALKNEGLEAHTLASFLHTKNKPIDDKTVLILDEAGVVGSRQMEQVMRIVETSGARMVMLGDTKQTEAIEAGKPFAQLQLNGMDTTRISEIQRQQQPELKAAVAHAAEGHVARSLRLIKHVEELPDSVDRHRAIAVDYCSLKAGERCNTLIVVGTNEARREINRMVREELTLAGAGREFNTLSRVDMTQAQRRYAPSFERGQVIQPEKNYPACGLVRGEIYHVHEALPGNLLNVKQADGSSIQFNPRKVTQLSVYQLERSELSVGDTVRINRNNPELDLTNGDRMRVASIVGGIVGLDAMEEKAGKPVRSVELLSSKPLHLEHAYVSTVHSSQGLTCSKSMISLDTSSRTTSMNLYYVAISRAKQEARIYTNSIADLPTAIARRFEKSTALSIQNERSLLRQAVNRKQVEIFAEKQIKLN